MRILIVDDSELIRDRLKESLVTIENVTIIGEATNGVRALQVISEKKPDFVILDIRMPKMNGIGVLENLRLQGSKIKTCIFTNHPYQQYKQKCLAEGADYFFRKTEDFNEVISLASKLATNYSKPIMNNVSCKSF